VIAQCRCGILYAPILGRGWLFRESYQNLMIWLHRYKDGANFHYVDMSDDATDTDVKEVETYFEIFRTKTEGADIYTARKTNNVRKKAYKIYSSKMEKAVPRFKVAKFRVALMLRCNADEGDKLKLYLGHHLEHPCALNNVSNYTRSV